MTVLPVYLNTDKEPTNLCVISKAQENMLASTVDRYCGLLNDQIDLYVEGKKTTIPQFRFEVLKMLVRSYGTMFFEVC